MKAEESPVWPQIDPKDRRLYVRQSDLASADAAHVLLFFADLKSGPAPEASLDAQLICGDTVSVLEIRGDQARVCNSRDGYIGWVSRAALSSRPFEPTHRVTAPRTFLYPGPDMKLPRAGYRSMGSLIEVTGKAETRGTRYAILADGTAIIERHITPIDDFADDFVSVAEHLLATPYLWGGNTGFGIDCSGLVQLAMLMSGENVLRDTDMQAATIGEPVDIGDDWQKLKRGDLLFWRGHVAIAQGRINGSAHIIHANGHTMDVTSEPVEKAVSRIAHLYEMPIGVKRP